MMEIVILFLGMLEGIRTNCAAEEDGKMIETAKDNSRIDTNAI